MKAFATLFKNIDETTKTNAKVDALVHYFSIVPEDDALWCIAMLTGHSPRRTVKTGEFRQWAAEESNLPMWLFEDSYHIVGDLAETIAMCLPPPTDHKNYTLTETMALLKDLKRMTEEERRKAIVTRWRETTPEERFIFNKLITGSFRVGVSKQLVIKAIAKHYKIEEDTVAHRLTGDWSAETTTLQDLLSEGDTEENYYRPYPFYLAYQLDTPAEELGDVKDWFIERKFDGIRGQFIKRRGQLFVWSRGEELMTEKFTEFDILKDILPDGTVIDGEVLPYKDGAPLPFHIMQTRIGRKSITKKSLSEAPLVMICYDLLELNGEDIRGEAIELRRQKLEQLLEQSQLENVVLPLIISPLVEVNTWDEVREERLRARETNSEGLMLKHKGSVYETGRRRGQWWKWKIDPLTVDGVLIYAQSGHGRRANLFTDYTFAVWDGDVLVPFAKAYSGLTDKELLQVDSWVKRNTIEKFGPVRSVKPELVFEIGFEGINKSPRHKSGIALRFPRILRWRIDKKKEDANHIADLRKLIETPGTDE